MNLKIDAQTSSQNPPFPRRRHLQPSKNHATNHRRKRCRTWLAFLLQTRNLHQAIPRQDQAQHLKKTPIHGRLQRQI